MSFSFCLLDESRMLYSLFSTPLHVLFRSLHTRLFSWCLCGEFVLLHSSVSHQGCSEDLKRNTPNEPHRLPITRFLSQVTNGEQNERPSFSFLIFRPEITDILLQRGRLPLSSRLPRLSDSFERRQKTSRSFWEQLWTNFCGWEQLTNCSTFFFPRGCPGNKACTLTFHSTYARDTGGGVGGGGLCGREIMWETDKALLPGDPQEHTSLSFFLRMWLVTAHHPDSWAASTIGN